MLFSMINDSSVMASDIDEEGTQDGHILCLGFWFPLVARMGKTSREAAYASQTFGILVSWNEGRK